MKQGEWEKARGRERQEGNEVVIRRSRVTEWHRNVAAGKEGARWREARRQTGKE